MNKLIINIKCDGYSFPINTNQAGAEYTINLSHNEVNELMHAFVALNELINEDGDNNECI